MGSPEKVFRSQGCFDPALTGKMHFFVQVINKGSITAAAEYSDLCTRQFSRSLAP